MARRQRLVVAVATLVASVAVLAWSQQARIGMWLFDRAIERNLGADRAAALPDGLHVYLCGSGSPLADADRAGPCIGVLAGKDAFVFDAGSGSVRKLLRMGFPPERLHAAFLTHLHSDHIDGLGELLLQAWIAGGRATPLPVYGPEGIDAVIGGLAAAYAADRDFRIAHHGPKIARPGGFGGQAQIIPEPQGTPPIAVVWERDGVRITAIRVNHAPVHPAFGYRIDYKGRSIAISGDTSYDPDVAVAAKGVDVLFHEALNPQMVAAMARALDRAGRRDAAQVMRDIPGYHTSPVDAARVAQAAGAGSLVLYHLVPPVPRGPVAAAFVAGAANAYSGPIRVGDDGLLVSLPANGKTIAFDQLL